MDIEYDIKIKQYVATAMTGAEVYGTTWAECEAWLREANRAYIAHCRKNPQNPALTDRDGQYWQANSRRLRDGI